MWRDSRMIGGDSRGRACYRTSTERPGDVILRMLFARILEDFLGRTKFDQITRAASLGGVHVQKRR